MAFKKNENLTWESLNTDGFTGDVAAKHTALRELFGLVREAKAEFEAAVNAAKFNPPLVPVTPGTSRKFSYMRGVAVAIAPTTKAKAKAGGATMVA